jgi:hypothetical protein
MHTVKNHKTGLFARMGGSFNRAFFTLAFYGDELEPSLVTKVLGASPTTSFRKGEERPRGSQYYRTGGWLLTSGELLLGENDSGTERFEDWLKSLPAEAARYDTLREFEPRVSIALYTDQMNAEFTLSAIAAEQLSLRKLALTFDPYLELDE